MIVGDCKLTLFSFIQYLSGLVCDRKLTIRSLTVLQPVCPSSPPPSRRADAARAMLLARVAEVMGEKDVKEESR